MYCYILLVREFLGAAVPAGEILEHRVEEPDVRSAAFGSAAIAKELEGCGVGGDGGPSPEIASGLVG